MSLCIAGADTGVKRLEGDVRGEVLGHQLPPNLRISEVIIQGYRA